MQICCCADGRKERVMFDKITSRVSKLCYGLNMDFVDPVSYFWLFSNIIWLVVYY